MTIVVLLKAVRRGGLPLRDAPASGTPLTGDAPLGINPADAQALRLALALVSSSQAESGGVVALSVAPAGREGPLRFALSHGARTAIRVWGRDWPKELAEGGDGSSTTTGFLARAAAASLSPLEPELVLAGARSADTGHECFGAFVAGALGMHFAHGATEIRRDGVWWELRVRLERGYGQEMRLPAPLMATVAGGGLPFPDPPLPEWLSALEAEIHLIVPAGSPPVAPPTILRHPIPRVMGSSLPAPGLNAEARMQTMMALPPGTGGRRIGPEAPPEVQAREIENLLREKGYVGKEG